MIWRPFTQEKIAAAPIKISRGEGAYLFSENGKKYVDLISSWWVNIHGHANKEIAEAIARQASTLEQVIFTAFNHDPAEQLVKKLKTVVSKNLRHFFFSDNGSTAVEVALKIAYQFFKNNGNTQRKIYLHLDGAYHGDTFGAMSVSGKNSMYHFNFSDFFFDTIAVKVPEFYGGAQDVEAREDEAIFDLERKLEQFGDKICALIVEPLLQGARGMVVHRPEFLERLVNTVRKFGVLVIFDEVMTGFYRTGKFFAGDYLREKPDLMCISKALTGGFLPLSITITTDQIYDAFLSEDWGKAFIHGHSYTGNPIACAAACKSFEILMRPETLARIQAIEKFYRSINEIPTATKKRNLGTMFAFDLPSAEQAKQLTNKLFEKGIFIRPLDKTIYLLPPYCVAIDELENAIGIMKAILKN